MKKIFYTGLLLLIALSLNAQDNSFKKDVQELIKLMGVIEQTQHTREDRILSVSPENEAAFTKKLDSLLVVYNQEVEEHFLEKYTHEEVKDIIKFYKLPLGKKFSAENKSYIAAYDEAKSLFYEKMGDIQYYVRAGKYKVEE